MRSLFLQAPSFDGYDGGAGARYQMKREVKSFWFPTWLAQAAAMVPGSRLIDAPPHGLTFKDIEEEVKTHDFIVIHTSTPSFKSDCKTAQMIRDLNGGARIGFIGAKVAVEPQQSLEACPAVDFVCRNEYEFTIKELAEGNDWSTIKGLSYRDASGCIRIAKKKYIRIKRSWRQDFLAHEMQSNDFRPLPFIKVTFDGFAHVAAKFIQGISLSEDGFAQSAGGKSAFRCFLDQENNLYHGFLPLTPRPPRRRCPPHP